MIIMLRSPQAGAQLKETGLYIAMPDINWAEGMTLKSISFLNALAQQDYDEVGRTIINAPHSNVVWNGNVFFPTQLSFLTFINGPDFKVLYNLAGNGAFDANGFCYTNKEHFTSYGIVAQSGAEQYSPDEYDPDEYNT